MVRALEYQPSVTTVSRGSVATVFALSVTNTRSFTSAIGFHLLSMPAGGRRRRVIYSSFSSGGSSANVARGFGRDSGCSAK